MSKSLSRLSTLVKYRADKYYQESVKIIKIVLVADGAINPCRLWLKLLEPQSIKVICECSLKSKAFHAASVIKATEQIRATKTNEHPASSRPLHQTR